MATNTDLIFRLFPELSEKQRVQISALEEIYTHWNTQLNLISRKDMEEFQLHHVLHSMSLAWYVPFKADQLILDIGTGGGFPGIPLAILYPQCRFLLIDSTLKKLKVIDDVCETLDISNVLTMHARIEELEIPHHHIVSRAVASLQTFISWVRPSVMVSGRMQKGIWYLKGGDCEEEARETGLRFKVFPLAERLEQEYFSTKKVVALWFP